MKIPILSYMLTKIFVTLRFQKATPFTVCFSSKTPEGYEKFGVYSFSLNNLYVGSPNIGSFEIKQPIVCQSHWLQCMERLKSNIVSFVSKTIC
jgi:hypothetical protein